MTANGLGAISPLGGDVNLPPGFVNPGAGDYHLLSTSPLIDKGDPAAPAQGSSRHRRTGLGALDGIFDCTVPAPAATSALTSSPDRRPCPTPARSFRQPMRLSLRSAPRPGASQPSTKKCKNGQEEDPQRAVAAKKKCKRKNASRLRAVDLQQGEKVIYEGHPSWRAILGFYLAGIAIGVGIGFIVEARRQHRPRHRRRRGDHRASPSSPGWSSGSRPTYTITDRRLNIKRGIIARKVQETRLGRVQNVNFQQGVYERVMQIGNVEFTTAGTEESNFVFAGRRRSPRRSSQQVDTATRITTAATRRPWKPTRRAASALGRRRRPSPRGRRPRAGRRRGRSAPR